MTTSRGRLSFRRAGALLLGALGCLLLAGCVHRQFTVTTSPPGAIVEVNGQMVGPTPVDVPFTYYGTYRLTIRADGYQTQVIDQCVPAPWYEYFPLEFISEHLIPYTFRDHRRFHYDLAPLVIAPPDAALSRAEQMRSEGKVTGIPLSGPVAPVTIPTQRPDLPEELPNPNPLPQPGVQLGPPTSQSQSTTPKAPFLP